MTQLNKFLLFTLALFASTGFATTWDEPWQDKVISTKHNGFGGNSMDPRICTQIPDVKTAIDELLNRL